MIAWGILLLILGLILLGQPLFVIIGAITAYLYHFVGESSLQGIIEDIFFAADKEILLAIPLFILAGNLMTHGGIARRLIRIASAVSAPVPGGLSIAAVLSCGIFAAISGSSPVTLIAVGSILFPALVAGGYRRDFSIGLLAAGGTLGIVIPPSIPMIIFAIMAGVSVTDLFIAGIGPGLLQIVLLILLSLVLGQSRVRGRWDGREVLLSLKDGALSLLMPGVILGGIYSGLFTATESASIAVGYAVLVEFAFHRELKLKQIPKVLSDSAEMLGTLFLILVLAVSLNKFLTFEQVPQGMVTTLSGLIESKMAFLIGVNLLLLVVGCFMDVMSAILILAPLLTPMATHYGVDPLHFGIIMIVNLEIGYLTPPLGINLFVASSVFKEPLTSVIRSLVPHVLTLLLGLALITYYPRIALFLLK